MFCFILTKIKRSSLLMLLHTMIGQKVLSLPLFLSNCHSKIPLKVHFRKTIALAITCGKMFVMNISYPAERTETIRLKFIGLLLNWPVVTPLVNLDKSNYCVYFFCA